MVEPLWAGALPGPADTGAEVHGHHYGCLLWLKSPWADAFSILC